MGATDVNTRSSTGHVAIAPAPAAAIGLGTSGHSSQSPPLMPYTCQACARRKVKCDKATPICSRCRKGKLECFYQTPLPRQQKRKLPSGDVAERLARYERILRQHGLLDAADSPSSVAEEQTEPPQEPISLNWAEPETAARTGRLLIHDDKSRYVDSSLWRSLPDGGMQRLSDDEDDEEEEDHLVAGLGRRLAPDPLTGALMGSYESLAQYHPTHAEAMMLWKTHAENVEPICKILHIPSTAKMIAAASQGLTPISKADECLMFAIYHFAVFSMTEEECTKRLGGGQQPRDVLLQRYHFAARQALVNASFLRTTRLSILQALVLFLLPCRYTYDSHTYWILTGVAVRIAQRMGIHRDGEKLSLPPFEVQMRRRLFYQLLPLDGIASQMSGTGISIIPDAWDTQTPFNINDDQIWPGMTPAEALPGQEQKGATEMIFCLTRACLGKFFSGMGRPAVAGVNPTALWQFKDFDAAERAIAEAEREVEERYIRYCDVVDPLHFLTMTSARSGVTAMRIRSRLSRIKNGTATDAERRELLRLAQKIMDTDAAAHSHEALMRRFAWHIRPFFLWGTWDSLIYLLDCLWKRMDLFSSPSTTDEHEEDEAEAAWHRVELVYHNHNVLLESRRALYVAFGRLTLKAWDAHHQPPSTPGNLNRPNPESEPAFIAALRSLQNKARGRRGAGDREVALGVETDVTMSIESSLEGGTDSDYTSLFDSDELSLNSGDWMFWDNLIRDHQAS